MMMRLFVVVGVGILTTACGLSPNIDLPSGRGSSDTTTGGETGGDINIGGADEDATGGGPTVIENTPPESPCDDVGGAGGATEKQANCDEDER